MSRFIRPVTLAASAALLLGGCAMSEPAEPELEAIILTAAPATDELTLDDRFGYFADLITEVTGLPVEYFEAPDYASVTEAIATGRAHLAHMDAFTYVAAKKRNPELSLLAGTARDPQDTPGYVSLGVTMLDSNVKSLADVAGRTVCFSDPASVGSYLWPRYELGKAGVSVDAVAGGDITSVFTGSQTSVAVGLFNGDCEVGFMPDGIYLFSVPTIENIDASQFRVFWESGEIPGLPLVAHPSLGADLIQAIRTVALERANKDAMVEAGLCGTLADCVYQTPSTWGYVENPESNYDVMREFCRENELEQCG